MTLAVAEKLRRKVMIEHREEECSRRWMLQQETIDDVLVNVVILTWTFYKVVEQRV